MIEKAVKTGVASRAVAVRLEPSCDFKLALLELIAAYEIKAGTIACAVGSLSTARLRLAGAQSVAHFDGPLEIVSATGTVGTGGLHVHMAVADASGTVYGGHLLDGCLVASTVELVILDFSDSWRFARSHDERTGYLELDIKNPK